MSTAPLLKSHQNSSKQRLRKNPAGADTATTGRTVTAGIERAYIGDNLYKKYDGDTFEFREPDVTRIPDYMALLHEFYPQKTRRVIQR